MLLDSEDQRKFFLTLIAGVNFSGGDVDVVYENKKALEKAGIALSPAEPETVPIPEDPTEPFG